MSTVVGIDLSLTTTGFATDMRRWAFARTVDLDVLTSIRVMRQMVTQACTRSGAPLVVIEDLPPARVHALKELAMLHGVVRVALDDLVHSGSIRGVVKVPPASLKRYATGRGNASKAEVLVAAVTRLGYMGADHNVADAMWLHAMGRDLLGDPVVEMPAAHRRALDAIDWPGRTA